MSATLFPERARQAWPLLWLAAIALNWLGGDGPAWLAVRIVVSVLLIASLVIVGAGWLRRRRDPTDAGR